MDGWMEFIKRITKTLLNMSFKRGKYIQVSTYRLLDVQVTKNHSELVEQMRS